MLLGMICVSSLVGHVVAHWLVMWRLIGRKWARFFVGYLVSHWLAMLWLIGWRCSGS